jgi:hypothetical protein
MPFFYGMTSEPQHKDLIPGSLTFVWDDIVMAGRSEECRATFSKMDGILKSQNRAVAEG